MAFDLNKFRREYHKVQAGKKELADKLEEAAAAQRIAVDAAVAAAAVPLQSRIRELELCIDQQVLEAMDLDTEVAALKFELAGSRDVAATLRERMEFFTAESAMWKAKYDEQQPLVDNAMAKVDELDALLRGVQERMRRREIQQRDAILNRKALATAVPARNRG